MRKIIEVKNLNYSYPDGTKALKNISFNVYEGESVGIIGGNGAGKTTLLLHLNGIINPSGSINVSGLKMAKENLRTIRSKVGLVFQNPDDQLFSPTVFDDVSFGPVNLRWREHDVIKSVKNALSLVGMDGYENKSPHHLSSGEKKKIAIATVLSMPCEILVLDEPSSNLDPYARTNFISLLKNLRQTKIIAGHDLYMVKEVCSRVIILNNGTIAEDGSSDEILQNMALLKKYNLGMPVLIPYS